MVTRWTVEGDQVDGCGEKMIREVVDVVMLVS